MLRLLLIIKMDKLRAVLSGKDQNEDETTILGQIDQASSLDWSTRIKGFAICFVLGIVLTILGGVFFLNIRLFATFYTLGSVLTMISTCFLMGPVKQLKRMFDPTRIMATIIYIVSLVLTIVAACVVSWVNHQGD